jgi:sialate O-acetylesterase
MDNQYRGVVTRLALAAAMFITGLATHAVAAEPEEAEAVPTPGPAAAAEPAVALGAPFADNAVLQRRMPLPVWGWGEPGTTVTVTFGGQTKTATADQSGKWVATLDPMEASFEPREMKITTSAGKERTIGNILVGEVWMASGQSNMQWKAEKSSSAKLVIEPRDGVEPIREFEVTSVFSQLHPIERATGSWKNGAYMTHSAVGLAFANTLYQQLDVPIGILNCSFSQTAIQAWVPAAGFRDAQDDYTKAIYKRVLEADPRTPEHKAAWDAYYQTVEAALNDNAARVAKGEWAQGIPTRVPGTFNGNRDATWMFNGRLSPVVPYAVRGAIWNQGYANIHEGIVYYNNLHSLVRGWRLVWDRPDMPVYFHQFYTTGADNPEPSIGTSSDMRMGAWLARDIPNAGMASQIDIGGAIHYRNKTVPGFRLALLALKNQYPETTIRQMNNAPQFGSGVGGKAADLVAEGPMFKSYRVEGNKVIVDFDNAEGGFVVGESGTKAHSKTGPGFAEVTVVPEGESKVKLFWLADADRVWHPATIKIEGSSVVVTSDAVASPRGVSYGTGGIAWQVNLYNTALLPMSPFIYYDQKLVTAENWPDPELKIAGKTIDPDSHGIVYEWRKMPILSTQFRDNAVLQAGQPITIWGSARNGEGEPAPANSVIQFSFDGVETTIPLDAPGPNLFQLAPEDTRNGDVGLEWRVTVPAMEASDKPRTITARLLVDGKVVHERVAKNVVVGDVWYIGTPGLNFPKPKQAPAADAPIGPVRVMARAAKRSSHDRPSRYSIAVSQAPDNRFASEWKNADDGFAAMFGQQIHARTGKPVGIIYMASVSEKDSVHPTLKEWIPYPSLKNAPSLMDDYRAMASLAPGNEFYDANARRYVEAWKDYWNKYIPTMIATKAVPDGGTWGNYPSLGGEISTEATKTYNVLVHSFTPVGLKGIAFVANPQMVKADEGAHFGEQLSALANGWRERFASPEARFFYTLPDAQLAPKVTAPGAIQGPSTAIKIGTWPTEAKTVDDLKPLVDQIISEAYPK